MPAPQRRIPLDRERVLDAGVTFADRAGLDALSMRALASELGVVPMALYKHVSDKDDLVSGMIDRVVVGYPPPDSEGGWRRSVRARVLAAREAGSTHPWLRRAIEAATRRTVTIMSYMDAMAGEFIRDGVSVDLTHYAMHALGHRIWGFNPEAFEAEAGADAGAPPSEEEQSAQMQMMAERFPNVTAIAVDAAARNPTGACDTQSEFEFTLDLLLDSFQRLHESGWISRPLAHNESAGKGGA